MVGVYVTVLVTTSRIWRTLRPLAAFCFFCSAKRALSAASQSKTEERTDLALKGERRVLAALSGDSKVESAGLGGNLRLGKQDAPVGGADMGN